jgi:anoctamin-10
MFIQFGYVFLFSSVYPMAALWAVMNNVVEIRVDAFKLCCLYQRSMRRRVKDTGAWQVIIICFTINPVSQ